ncbi:MAG: hypothetical protein ACREQ3_00280 [Candidatus Binatia bacterium]
MPNRNRIKGLMLGLFLGGLLCSTVGISTAGDYPPDYKPSKPVARGEAETNVLKRFGAVNDYVTERLNAAGGSDSPACFRSCMTAPLNEIIKCLETKTTYATSESCEQDAAQKVAACDPKCQ